MAWWRSFWKSSTIPITPNTRANRNTYRWLQFPAKISSRPATSAAAAMAMINMTPPMVGVPCLAMCQVGPSERMDCPAFSRRSRGMRICPTMAATPKAMIKLRMNVILEPSRFFLF